jgi:hypothetical protein
LLVALFMIAVAATAYWIKLYVRDVWTGLTSLG